MHRATEQKLTEWHQRTNRKPLILRGARQVGKTWLVQNWGATVAHVIHLNFERDPELVACFAPNDPREVLMLLEARLRTSIAPAESLLFLDEIQVAPSLLAKLRWFAEEMPELPVIAAGSLLDFALDKHSFSMPVGRISYGHLEPMTFLEFLHAQGEERLVRVIQECTTNTTIPEPLHVRLLELMRLYAFVGGMPAAVNAWLERRSLLDVSEVHRDLLQTIRDDFSKYKRAANIDRLTKVFAAIPRFVGRKFQPTHVDRDERSSAINEAFRLLTLARVVTPVQRSAANGIPLAAEVDDRYRKVCCLDVGLYTTQLGVDASVHLDPTEISLIHEGQLAEQLVGQELRACRPFNQEPALFTWVRQAKSSNAEVDYVLQAGERVVPIEVKAGATGALRSLHMFVQEKKADLAVRISTGPLQLCEVTTALPVGPQRTFQLLSIPFYLTSELPRLLTSV